jgi:ribosomal protein S18 acetylase RimI-like enzyme
VDADALDRFETGSAQDDDLDDVVRLMESADRALGIPAEPVREDLIWSWHLPTVDMSRDTRIVRDDGAVVGYGEAFWKHPAEGGPLILTVRVDPGLAPADIETWLFAWGERVANERGAEGIRSDAANSDGQRHDLLRARGYVHVRSSFAMLKRLEADEQPGSQPAGITIRRYEQDDERALFEVNEASFADHWGFRPTSFESFNEELHGEDWDPSLVFLAAADGTTVGFVVPFLFETGGYIAMLGVLKEWRGLGIATALLRRSFAELAGRGMGEVRLHVDSQNAHGAVALYEGVGMSVYNRYDTFDLGTAETASGGPSIT